VANPRRQCPLEGGLFLRLRGFEVPLEALLRGTFLGTLESLGLGEFSYFLNNCLPKKPTRMPDTPATTAQVPGAIEDAIASSIERLPGVMVITYARCGLRQ